MHYPYKQCRTCIDREIVHNGEPCASCTPMQYREDYTTKTQEFRVKINATEKIAERDFVTVMKEAYDIHAISVESVATVETAVPEPPKPVGPPNEVVEETFNPFT